MDRNGHLGSGAFLLKLGDALKVALPFAAKLKVAVGQRVNGLLESL